MEGEASSLTGRPARLLIADEHELVREGLKAVLEGEPEFKVVGEAGDGCEVLQLCRELGPDVVLMDMRMRRADGLEVTRAIREELPSTAVVIVTLLNPTDYFSEAIEAGAADYVLKDVPHHDLVSTVRRVLSGGKPPRRYRRAAYGHTPVSPRGLESRRSPSNIT
jgi:DNA-binding NarL/FixJ family response regulator